MTRTAWDAGGKHKNTLLSYHKKHGLASGCTEEREKKSKVRCPREISNNNRESGGLAENGAKNPKRYGKIHKKRKKQAIRRQKISAERTVFMKIIKK